MKYRTGSDDYILNLIDTPGHVDFSYEVDRTLACVEGAILLVDATQGIQAQTIANAYKAVEKNLAIIPVVNKIDLPNAQVEQTISELVDLMGVQAESVFRVSAKTGEGVPQLLQALTSQVPVPVTKEVSDDLQALIFDSYFDSHRGVIAFVRIFNGSARKGTKVRLAQNGIKFEINEVGIFSPDLDPKDELMSGEIGYIVTNLKDIHEVNVGDTILNEKSTLVPLSGYRKIKPMVYASMFPTNTQDYPQLQKSLEKLYLNDSALEFQAIYSQALGAGFRVGFLGLLHADVVRERLEREFNLSLVLTPPQVDYLYENNQYQEPMVRIMILTPSDKMGDVMQLAESYRARFITMDNKNQISLTYEMPLSEMIADFFDNLKSVTSGYASFDWEFLRYDPVNADKLTVSLNDNEVEEFSQIIPHERSIERAQTLVKKLKDVIPRQQYEVKIQARYKGKVIASERISAFRKDVTAKLYGGDRTRKDKLLDKQKEGKKRMKMIGSVEVPKEAFINLFKNRST